MSEARQPTSTGTPAEQPAGTSTPAKQRTGTGTPAKQPAGTGTPAKQRTGTGTPAKQPAGAGTSAKQLLARADAFQQQHVYLALPVAVVRKFGDDKSANLASMIAFWAFFSIFPLLLVFVTLLGFFLPASMKTSVLTRVAEMFPLLSADTVRGLGGQWWPLLLGAVSALWSGLSVVRTVETAFNSVWEIPQIHRPKLMASVLRSLWVLAVMGGGLVVSVLITGYITSAAAGASLGWAGRLAGYIIAIALDVGLFIAAFRILTQQQDSTRDVLPGALLSGVSFWVLQAVSSLIISRYLHKAQSTYGHFATVITILWWFYIQAMISLLGAQLNAVLSRRLYPRSLTKAPDTEADRRAYESYAKERTYHQREDVQTEFRPGKQSPH